MKRVSEVVITKSRKGTVTTKDGGKVISVYNPTEQYEIVQFSDAVAQLLAVVGSIFKPEFYAINIKTGFQELKLRGKEVIINGDVFHELIWLTNSSNGSRRLSVRYGLMRQVCSNGACITLKGTSFQIKHLVSNNVNEELKAFMKSLPKLDVMEQVRVIKSLNAKKIKVKDLITKLHPENKMEITPAFIDLVKKFSSSKTDAIGTKKDALITGLNVPIKDMTKEILDTPINAYSIFNCYTELFRSADASMVEAQTNKILEVIG
jgi:hypothetical protein